MVSPSEFQQTRLKTKMHSYMLNIHRVKVHTVHLIREINSTDILNRPVSVDMTVEFSILILAQKRQFCFRQPGVFILFCLLTLQDTVFPFLPLFFFWKQDLR